MLKLGSILRALCPRCNKGRVTEGLLGIRKCCPECDYNFHPEPGFYLGAMAIGFLVGGALMIPPMVVLKLMRAEIWLIITWPFVQFAFVGTFLMFYSRILWLHLEYRMTRHLDQRDESDRAGRKP